MTKKEEYRGQRYAVEFLKPEKGKFLYHVISTAILLFVVVFLYTWADYGKLLSIVQCIKLVGWMFLFSGFSWGAAYLYKKYIKKDL